MGMGTKLCAVIGATAVVGAFCLEALGKPRATAGYPPLQDAVRTMDATGPYVNEVARPTDAFAVGNYAHLLDKIPPAKNTGPGWALYATDWTQADEDGYSAFVQAMGRSGCISIDDCLRSPANPYRDLEDDTLWLGDCTDMVYVLRGYYAWKNGLPFSYQDRVAIQPGKGAGIDARYSKYGNRVAGRFDVIQVPGASPRDGGKLLRRLFNIVSTAMLRVQGEDQGRYFSDFYPIEISRDAVRPGAVAYDVYGHVSIVYDVADDGRIMLISSHPDYTVSRDNYGPNFLRTGPELGGGLKDWRPVTLVGATKTAKGTYVGGRMIGAKNADLPHYSAEQFFGTHPDETGDWEKGRFVTADGRALPYYDFVKAQLRKPGLPFDPVAEVANATDALCAAFRARRTAVNLAIYADIPNKPAPKKLPANIYGTYGDWERYATPSRDARLKTQAVELRQMVESLLTQHATGDPNLHYGGGDLAAALLDVYDRGANACKLSYRRTDGKFVRLTMHHVTDRIFDLSFDPFHCAERRWGAKSDYEMNSCGDTADKTRWYQAQRFLRNDPGRTYDLRTDFEAKDLKDPDIAPPGQGGLGRTTPPDVDVMGFLLRYAGDHVTAGPDLSVDIIKASDAINE